MPDHPHINEIYQSAQNFPGIIYPDHIYRNGTILSDDELKKILTYFTTLHPTKKPESYLRKLSRKYGRGRDFNLPYSVEMIFSKEYPTSADLLIHYHHRNIENSYLRHEKVERDEHGNIIQESILPGSVIGSGAQADVKVAQQVKIKLNARESWVVNPSFSPEWVVRKVTLSTDKDYSLILKDEYDNHHKIGIYQNSLIKFYSNSKDLSVLTMPLLSGDDLFDLIEEQHLSFSEKIHIFIGILSELSKVFQKGMYFGDLKPENIKIFGRDDDIKVSLFDLGGTGKIGQAPQIWTEEYIPPELLKEILPKNPLKKKAEKIPTKLNFSSDLYALGKIIEFCFDADERFLNDNTILEHYKKLQNLHVILTNYPFMERFFQNKTPEYHTNWVIDSLQDILATHDNELGIYAKDNESPIAAVLSKSTTSVSMEETTAAPKPLRAKSCHVQALKPPRPRQLSSLPCPT